MHKLSIQCVLLNNLIFQLYNEPGWLVLVPCIVAVILLWYMKKVVYCFILISQIIYSRNQQLIRSLMLVLQDAFTCVLEVRLNLVNHLLLKELCVAVAQLHWILILLYCSDWLASWCFILSGSWNHGKTWSYLPTCSSLGYLWYSNS